MKTIFAECFNSEQRVAAMGEAFRRLQFYSFEVRTLGVIRVGIVVLSAFITTLASIHSNSPIPLFLLLAIIVQSFVGSLFPRHGSTLNLANPALALPLLTLASVFHFAATFLWNSYQEKLGQHIVVWSCLLVMGLATLQFAYSTLNIHLRTKTTADRIRWTYAVVSLVITVFDLTVSRAAKYYPEVQELLAPFLQGAEDFLRIDYVLVSGFFLLVLAEGVYNWSKMPSAWGPKHYYVPIEYPEDDVGDSFFKSIPRDAQLRLIALASWISVQVKNLWRLVYGILKGFRTLLHEIEISAVRYGKAGLSSSLLLVGNLLPLLLVGLALFLAYRSAASITTRNGALFVLVFYLYMFGSACVLLIAYLTHYYLFAREIARHFRQSFFGFVHFCVLICMLLGAVFWYLLGTEFTPGYSFYLSLAAYSTLAVGIYRNRSEFAANKKPFAATGGLHEDARGGSNTARSGSHNPGYGLFTLMIVLATSVAWKQWLDDPAMARLKEEARKVEEVHGMRKAEEEVKAAISRKVEEAKRRPTCPPYGINTWTNCYGFARYTDGGKYGGEWTGGKRHGQGTFVSPGGATSVGEWRDGALNGRGFFTAVNGDTYVGEFSNGRPYGQGTYTWSNSGQKYAGQWDGKRKGRGTLYGADGTILKTGIWEDNSVVTVNSTKL